MSPVNNADNVAEQQAFLSNAHLHAPGNNGSGN